MEDGDALLRLMLLSLVVAGVVIVFLGGLLTPAGGHYRDGARELHLYQLGPFIWGNATLADGRQFYRGRAFWGHVWLTRRDTGTGHLQSLGFTAQQAPWLERQVTASLVFRSRSDGLVGSFIGRKFSFGQEGIARVDMVEPVQRRWQRLKQHPQVGL